VLVAVATTGLAIPIVMYLGVHAAVGAGFRFESADGWLLYGRVGAIVNDCKGASVPARTRALCNDDSHHPQSPDWYVSDPQSPANRMFPGGFRASSNSALRAFAIDIIRAHPISYAHLVARDTIAFFAPGHDPGPDLSIPRRGDTLVLDQRQQTDRERYFPGYRLPQPRSNSLVARYYHRVRVPRIVFGLAALLGVADVGLGFRRGSSSRRALVALLTGGSLLALVGSVATVGFYMRYSVPFQPLLLAGGALAMADIWPSAFDARRAQPRHLARHRM
jgi:hypothetical protein